MGYATGTLSDNTAQPRINTSRLVYSLYDLTTAGCVSAVYFFSAFDNAVEQHGLALAGFATDPDQSALFIVASSSEVCVVENQQAALDCLGACLVVAGVSYGQEEGQTVTAWYA